MKSSKKSEISSVLIAKSDSVRTDRLKALLHIDGNGVNQEVQATAPRAQALCSKEKKSGTER